MLEHCTATYGSSSNWLIHLDVDEFLSVTSSLYGADAPYPPAPSEDDPTTSSSWQYPLHDLLARPELADAACIPLPELNYRNLGVRELAKGQGVLDTQTHRDVLKQGKRVVREEGLQQKVCEPLCSVSLRRVWRRTAPSLLAMRRRSSTRHTRARLRSTSPVRTRARSSLRAWRRPKA